MTSVKKKTDDYYQIKTGRPKGSVSRHTLDVVEARKLLISWVIRDLGKIYPALLAKAVKGDVLAIKELFDRSFGKSITPIAIGGDTKGIVFMPLELIEKHALQTDEDVLKSSATDVKHVEAPVNNGSTKP